jgi:hypothetical protein
MIIFCGPTIRPKDILVKADVRKPAAQGDIAAAATENPGETLVLIDGYFRQELAPWHKEILYAMQEKGCRFVGGGSLGAIRSVECEPWGAEPVGQIARWFKDGTIVDDSEVALLHEQGGDYKHFSVPLVNLRASGCPDIEKLAAIPFEDRSWRAIADVIGEEKCAEIQLNYVDQKFIDAQAAIVQAALPAVAKGRVEAKNLNSILLESMLGADMPTDGERPYQKVCLEERAATMKEQLLLHLAESLKVQPTQTEVHEAAGRMWKRIGCPSPEQQSKWFEKNKVTLANWWQRAEEEAKLSSLLTWQDSCDTGMRLVARTINRGKFYKSI